MPADLETAALLDSLRGLSHHIFILCGGVNDEDAARPFVDSISIRSIVTDLINEEIAWADCYFQGRDVAPATDPLTGIIDDPTPQQPWRGLLEMYRDRATQTEGLLNGSHDLSTRARHAGLIPARIATPTLRGVMLQIITRRAAATEALQLGRIAFTLRRG